MKHLFKKLGYRGNMSGNFGSKHPNSKKIEQYDLNGKLINIFGGVREAARLVGLKSHHSIYACCIGRYKQSGGFIWRYANER